MKTAKKWLVAGIAAGLAACIGFYAATARMGPLPLRMLATKGSIPVLMYHHIDEQGGRYSVTPDTFRSHLMHLYQHGYRLISPEKFMDGSFYENLR